MFCYNCGSRVIPNTNFCTQCGAKLKVQATQPVHAVKPVHAAQTASTMDETEHQKSKSEIEKIEKAIKDTGKSAAAVGWVGIFLSPLVALAYLFNDLTNNAWVFGLLALGYFISLMVIYLGSYIQTIYRKDTRAALWLLLILCLVAYMGLIPLIVAVSCINALIKLKKIRNTTYFETKRKHLKPFRFSTYEKVALLVSAVVTLVVAGYFMFRTPPVPEGFRNDFISGCNEAVNKNLTRSQQESYCTCAIDYGMEKYGTDRYVEMLSSYRGQSNTPAEVQSVIDHCNSTL
jgi:hypothetical protein